MPGKRKFVGTPTYHPTDQDLSAGTPIYHPTDQDLSVGTQNKHKCVARAGHPDLPRLALEEIYRCAQWRKAAARAAPVRSPTMGTQAYFQLEGPFPAMGRRKWVSRGPKSRAGLMA